MQYIHSLNISLFFQPIAILLLAALLEKKTDLDKRGMGLSDYSNGMNKPLVCRPSARSKDPSDRSAFLDKVSKRAADRFYKYCLEMMCSNETRSCRVVRFVPFTVSFYHVAM